MQIGMATMCGFWPDYYICKKDNIIETINRMLQEHAEDFPRTACGGFIIEHTENFVKIIPVVLRGGTVNAP